MADLVRRRNQARIKIIPIKFNIKWDKYSRKFYLDMGPFDSVILWEGAQVIWQAPKNVFFTIDFGPDSPFETRYIKSEMFKEREYRTSPVRIREELNRANQELNYRTMSFKYTIAAHLKKENIVVAFDPCIELAPPAYNSGYDSPW